MLYTLMECLDPVSTSTSIDEYFTLKNIKYMLIFQSHFHNIYLCHYSPSRDSA